MARHETMHPRRRALLSIKQKGAFIPARRHADFDGRRSRLAAVPASGALGSRRALRARSPERLSDGGRRLGSWRLLGRGFRPAAADPGPTPSPRCRRAWSAIDMESRSSTGRPMCLKNMRNGLGTCSMEELATTPPRSPHRSTFDQDSRPLLMMLFAS